MVPTRLQRRPPSPQLRGVCFEDGLESSIEFRGGEGGGGRCLCSKEARGNQASCWLVADMKRVTSRVPIYPPQPRSPRVSSPERIA
jgi:hypothetical protein